MRQTFREMAKAFDAQLSKKMFEYLFKNIFKMVSFLMYDAFRDLDVTPTVEL